MKRAKNSSRWRACLFVEFNNKNMAPKRKATSKTKTQKNNAPDSQETQTKRQLTREDVICPVCLSILINPVTMPCSHRICMPCFQNTVEQANTTCPLCRKRLSLWYRKSAKNSLVDEPLWKEIQEQFPDLVKARLEGSDPDLNLEEYRGIPTHLLVPVGEIKKEFDAELTKLQAENCQRQEEAEKASRLLIERMIQEEEEEKRRLEEERVMLLQRDEELAKTLAQDLSEPKVRNSIASKLSKGKSAAVKRSLNLAFGSSTSPSAFKPATPTSVLAQALKNAESSTSRQSADSIGPETSTVFRPISSAPKTPPKASSDGSTVEPVLVQPVNLMTSSGLCKPKNCMTTPRSQSQPSCSTPLSLVGSQNAASTFSSVMLAGNVEMSPISQKDGALDQPEVSVDGSLSVVAPVHLSVNRTSEVPNNEAEEYCSIRKNSLAEDVSSAKKIPKRSTSPEYFFSSEVEPRTNNNVDSIDFNLSQALGEDVDEDEFKRAQKALEDRLEQERKDMEFALQLQKDLDKQRKVELNKRDSYALRGKTKGVSGQLSLKDMLGKRKR